MEAHAPLRMPGVLVPRRRDSRGATVVEGRDRRSLQDPQSAEAAPRPAPGPASASCGRPRTHARRDVTPSRKWARAEPAPSGKCVLPRRGRPRWAGRPDAVMEPPPAAGAEVRCPGPAPLRLLEWKVAAGAAVRIGSVLAVCEAAGPEGGVRPARPERRLRSERAGVVRELCAQPGQLLPPG